MSPPAPLSVRSYQIEDHDVVEATGEVDVYTAPELRAALEVTFRRPGGTFIVDLGPTTFMDSSGLGALIGALKRVRVLEGELVLVVSALELRRVFELTGLDQVMHLVETLDDALHALADPVA